VAIRHNHNSGVQQFCYRIEPQI